MSFHMKIGRGLAAGLVAAGLALSASLAGAQEKVRVALGDVVSVETLAFIVALERAKDRGVDYELTSFAKEELAIQAIVNGQADLGIGTPYAVIQKTKVPLRIVFQMSRAGVLPGRLDRIQDLAGPERPALHLPCARDRHRSLWQHHRGAGKDRVRPAHLRAGLRKPRHRAAERHIKATILDLANKNRCSSRRPTSSMSCPASRSASATRSCSPMPTGSTSHAEQANIVVEELLKLWREMNENPDDHRGGAGEAEPPRRPAEGSHRGSARLSTTEGVEAGLFDKDGGNETIAKADFEFYTRPARSKARPTV